jgi:hypothetical protein
VLTGASIGVGGEAVSSVAERARCATFALCDLADARRLVALLSMSNTMSSLAPEHVPTRLVDGLTAEEIKAEYEHCRRPDGTLDLERFAEMTRRLYGYTLAEGHPPPTAQAAAVSEMLERWAREPVPDNEPEWEIVSHNPFEIRVVPRP